MKNYQLCDRKVFLRYHIRLINICNCIYSISVLFISLEKLFHILYIFITKWKENWILSPVFYEIRIRAFSKCDIRRLINAKQERPYLSSWQYFSVTTRSKFQYLFARLSQISIVRTKLFLLSDYPGGEWQARLIRW